MSKLIIPDPCDTQISEIEYGIDILVIVHGRKQERHFNKVLCQSCGEIIPAKYITDRYKGYILIGNTRHNATKYHDGPCRNNSKYRLMTQAKIDITKPMQKGYPALPVTKQKFLKMARFIVSL